MDRKELYFDIAKRTQGDIYLGVTGPVRTGKSTFIRRFMELVVLPNVENEHVRARMADELPQSANGRTIMTTQPSFVPNEAVAIELGDHASCRVRLIDCVGFLCDGALGHMENDVSRMVKTPWSEDEMPFAEAAELGTRKVMREHSTIGIVITTDGTIADIPRAGYEEAEARVIDEMKKTGKPFVIVVNSTQPESEAAEALRAALEERYGVGTYSMDVLHMSERRAQELIEYVLLEFPLRMLEVRIPPFLSALPNEHPLVRRVMLPMLSAAPKCRKLRDYKALLAELSDVERFLKPRVEKISLGEGTAIISLAAEDGLFYEVLGEQCGCDVKDEATLMRTLRDYARAKSEYDRVSAALNEASEFGYGLVPPAVDEMRLEEPEIVRQGNRFGVRLRARASGLHIIRVDVESEVNPIVGTEQQSEALVKYIGDTFETDPQAIWKTNIFGKPLYDLVRDGMEEKVGSMPYEVRERVQGALQKIVNDGCSNLICIMF